MDDFLFVFVCLAVLNLQYPAQTVLVATLSKYQLKHAIPTQRLDGFGFRIFVGQEVRRKQIT